MKNILTFLFLSVVLLYGCSDAEKQNIEIISMEDFIGESTQQLDEQTDTIIDTLIDISIQVQQLITSLRTSYDTSKINTSHLFDRYGYNSSYKIQFIGKEKVSYGKTLMVAPKADLFIYHFSDSIKLNNAFYNWLDCFGSNCQEVKLHQNIDYIKTPPSFTLVYDTTLVTVKYQCEHTKNDWSSFQDSIIKKYGNNYRYRIDVDCGGPLIWK
ncbi:MAG TPA: hypothetical protein EYG85_08895 [Crocinitomix sp.]|nr:hypothetical protein [Crocinitomix sp.]